MRLPNPIPCEGGVTECGYLSCSPANSAAIAGGTPISGRTESDVDAATGGP